MATVAPTRQPNLESLAHIDITKLSQSELHALSLCSNSAYNLRHANDVVIPQIDRSLFNESTCSRRQTYSRLRHQRHRSRVPGHHPSTSQPKPGSSSDPETHSILHFLKYFINNPNSNSPPPPPPPPPPSVTFPATQPGIQEKLMNECDKKRKRGRKHKDNKQVKDNRVRSDVVIVNENGEVVDLNNLESNGDKLYNGELEKRTVGLKTEEEVLGFVRDLEGQWCSRRKRRKYVDASGFGDTLPIGWKLLLALRRRDGRVWVYCRRYVSPTGQQFISCKEASSYLRSHFLSGEANQQVDATVSKSVSSFHGDTSLVLSTNIQENPHSLQKGDVAKHDIVAHAVVPSSSTLDLHLSEVCLMEMDNLPEVKVQDIFECYKCNLTFEEKNAYLQHLFSFHQRTTRRYRVGPSVGDGVIIRDGKYECQFCHKVFEERRSYNGHVGVHVRNNARGTVDVAAAVAADKSVQSPHHDGLPSTCKMDALIEIAQNSVVETSSARPATKGSSMPSSTSMGLDGNMATNIDQVARSNIETCLEQGRDQPDNTCMGVDKNRSGEILANKFNPRVISTNDYEQPEDDEAKKAGSNKAVEGLGKEQTKENDDVQPETVELTFQEIASQNALTSSSVSTVRSLYNDFEHSEDGDVKKDGTDNVAVGEGNSLTKANDVESETMELSSQDNATLNGLTSSSLSMVEPSHSTFEHPESDDMKKDGNDPLVVCLGQSLTEAYNDVEPENIEFTFQQNATQDELASFSEPMVQVQPFDNSTGILSGSNKDDGEVSAIGQTLDNGTGFEEFRLDEIEHFEYSFDVGHQSPSLPVASIGLSNDARMEEAFASVGFDSGGIILNMEDQLSTICVWCRAEFKLEAYDTEAHSDSIGFMCPDCKAKISGHLESGLSLSPHGF
ncbi:uncharacterized protein LOC132598799 [Lycium barbarum]|uniref:uncharacterized protein LOC132598799 n=1 Tax=Lycium barbarum TaxID=112863 RepID=UPI00293EFC6A|nr:uncharacterized protein LOC132598799 [Lycium barbarum]